MQTQRYSVAGRTKWQLTLIRRHTRKLICVSQHWHAFKQIFVYSRVTIIMSDTKTVWVRVDTLRSLWAFAICHYRLYDMRQKTNFCVHHTPRHRHRFQTQSNETVETRGQRQCEQRNKSYGVPAIELKLNFTITDNDNDANINTIFFFFYISFPFICCEDVRASHIKCINYECIQCRHSLLVNFFFHSFCMIFVPGALAPVQSSYKHHTYEICSFQERTTDVWNWFKETRWDSFRFVVVVVAVVLLQRCCLRLFLGNRQKAEGKFIHVDRSVPTEADGIFLIEISAMVFITLEIQTKPRDIATEVENVHSLNHSNEI